MPVVRVPGRQVATAPLPGVRRTAAETAISEGAGLERAKTQTGAAVAEVGAAVAAPGLRIVAREQAERRRNAEIAKDQADTLAVIAADNQLADWTRTRLHDPQHGALSIRGQAALGLPEQIDGEYRQVADDIASKLSTPEQRVGFARVRSQRQQAMAMELERHVENQIQTYAASELAARVDNAIELTVANASDPAAASRELDAGEVAIRRLGGMLGHGPEQTEKEVRALKSSAVVGIIGRLLAEQKTTAARAYFDETKGLIAADKIDDVTRALREGTLRQRSQQEFDRIVAGGGTLTEQREKARAIEDPETRDQVLQYVEHEWTVRDKVKADAQADRLRGAFDVVDKGKSVDAIPADVWGQLEGNERAALWAYARQRAAGVPIQTEWGSFYSLLQTAADHPAEFAAFNLYSVRHQLDDPEFKQLADLQLSIKSGARQKAEEQLAGFRSKQEILDQTLAQYGIDPKAKPTTKTGKAIAQLHRMLDLRVEAAQTAGVKVTNVEIQRTLDELLAAQVKVPGVWWGALWPGGRSPWDTSKRLLDVTVDEIPQADRAQIEKALRDAQRPVTDETVLDLFLETMIRNPGR